VQGSSGAGAESDQAVGGTRQAQSGFAGIIVAAHHGVNRSRHDADQRRVSSVITSTQHSCLLYKPNSITLAGSELVWSWFEAGSCQIPLH